MRQIKPLGTYLTSFEKLFVYSKTRYHSFSGEEDPRFDSDLTRMDPESRKSLTKYYSIDFPEILIGWKIVLCDGRAGTVLSCKRRFMRAAIFDVSFTDKTFSEQVVLNRKAKKNRRKYIDFELVSKEF